MPWVECIPCILLEGDISQMRHISLCHRWASRKQARGASGFRWNTVYKKVFFWAICDVILELILESSQSYLIGTHNLFSQSTCCNSCSICLNYIGHKGFQLWHIMHAQKLYNLERIVISDTSVDTIDALDRDEASDLKPILSVRCYNIPLGENDSYIIFICQLKIIHETGQKTTPCHVRTTLIPVFCKRSTWSSRATRSHPIFDINEIG